MRISREKSVLRFYFIIVAALLFLFFTNDFGTLDVQKTAIVIAVGVDREDDEFLLTTQIAVPQASTQGRESQTQQLTSRGKTIAQAFKQINAKTGWYPKLVFCNLILLGESTLQKNAFDALEFFFLDEYLSDDCLLAGCKGSAQRLLNAQALLDEASGLAIQKVLSPHAERVGTVLPCTLREFAIGYYSDSHSSYLPLLQTQPQQEKSTQTAATDGDKKSQQQEKQTEKPVFSAGETALVVGGKQVDAFTQEETFAFAAVKSKLRLAAFDTEVNESTCSLQIKNNAHKIRFALTDDKPSLTITIKVTAGLLDNSSALPLEKSADVGDVPSGAFAAAEKRLFANISSAFEKCKRCGCDLFELRSLLQKYYFSSYSRLKNSVLQDTSLQLFVQFRNVR